MKSELQSALASVAKAMKGEDVTDLFAFRKMKKGLEWAVVAKKAGDSREWVTAACPGPNADAAPGAIRIMNLL